MTSENAPPRGKIIMMAVIAGAVVTNIYCTQPVLPLIASDMGVAVSTVNLVAGAALLGFATGLAFYCPWATALTGASWYSDRLRWRSALP